MESVKIVELVKESGRTRKEVNAVLKSLGIKPYRAGGKLAVDADEAMCVLKEMELPEQLKPKRVKASFLRDARNPKWVYATVQGYPGKHAVIVPRNRKKDVINKDFWVDVIEDAHGRTFRHEWFSKFTSYRA